MQIKEINKLKNEIEDILNDNKAVEVKSINLKDKTSVADFMMNAPSEISKEQLKELGIKIVEKKE